ncbi:MAG: sigma-54-dependent Fis family transcriptional regulator [Ignavibacteriales bacterium]|nr:Regulatory protein AtoC [Ignavibacteriaceae bacterium]MCK6614425.1 sigma-54 dependent transcriptional regulator [Ignavibacteriaceae bacterium]QOJ29836.1 MAG: sigma-54-dependent Fis family transcriptional regulator [Ignavibacteriales bacterium]
MPEKILVVDDEDIIRDTISVVLKKEGYQVDEAENGLIAFNKIQENFYDLVITDIEMPEMKGIELLERSSKAQANASFIIITAYGSLDTAIRALRSGANDYILKPVEFDELLIKINRLFETRRLILENQMLRREVQRDFDYSNFIGKSPAMKRIFDIISAVGPTESTVLITGNSGTGKELTARAIHQSSKRKNRPFLAVNCGAISENLIESELFGHKKGAFTGASNDKEGYLKAADGGTLFLDEISEMPQQLQVKLLRVIQEKECTPVGSTVSLPINVRFIASTNRNLREEITKGTFREDLYYRLNVVEIKMPSLRERKTDIPLLIDHFLDKFRKEMGRSIKGVDHKAMKALIAYDWRGEVRELANVMERAVIFADTEYIGVEELPDYFKPDRDAANQEKIGVLDEYIRKVERDYIVKTLETYNYDKEQVAMALDLGLSTLYRKIKELGIEV